MMMMMMIFVLKENELFMKKLFQVYIVRLINVVLQYQT